jgi:replication-associated recombination protein RarA
MLVKLLLLMFSKLNQVVHMNTEIKYMPKSIDEFVFANDKLKLKVERYARGDALRPLILHGTHGTGKSLLSKLIPKAIEGDGVQLTKIHAEDLNSTKEIRSQFVRSSHFDSLFQPEGQSRNYNIIDEANEVFKGKSALRESIDAMNGRDLTIFTTNEVGKMDVGLLSRCEVVEVPPVPAERFLPRAQEILRDEGVVLPDEVVLSVLESVYEAHKDNREYYKALDELIYQATEVQRQN